MLRRHPPVCEGSKCDPPTASSNLDVRPISNDLLTRLRGLNLTLTLAASWLPPRQDSARTPCFHLVCRAANLCPNPATQCADCASWRFRTKPRLLRQFRAVGLSMFRYATARAQRIPLARLLVRRRLHRSQGSAHLILSCQTTTHRAPSDPRLGGMQHRPFPTFS